MKYNHAIRRSESSIEIQAPCYWYVVTIRWLTDSTEIYLQYTAQEDRPALRFYYSVVQENGWFRFKRFDVIISMRMNECQPSPNLSPYPHKLNVLNYIMDNYGNILRI